MVKKYVLIVIYKLIFLFVFKLKTVYMIINSANPIGRKYRCTFVENYVYINKTKNED